MQKSLLKRIHDVEEKATALRALNQQEQELKQIKQYIMDISELKTELYVFDKVYRAVYKIHVIPESFNRNEVCKLSEEFRLVTSTTEKPGVDWRANGTKIRKIKKNLQGYTAEINKAWKAYCVNRIEGNVGIVDTLGRIFDSREVKLIGDISANRKKILESSPRDAETIQKQIEIYDAKCHELLDSLDLNDKIIDFLRMLTTNGKKVYMSDIDTEILDWLKENKFAGKLEVRFG